MYVTIKKEKEGKNMKLYPDFLLSKSNKYIVLKQKTNIWKRRNYDIEKKIKDNILTLKIKLKKKILKLKTKLRTKFGR